MYAAESSLEVSFELDDRWSADNDHDRREDEEDERKHHFDRRLERLLFRLLAALRPNNARLHSDDATDADSHRLSLDDRIDQLTQFFHPRALRHINKGVSAGTAHLNFAHRP